MPAPPLSDDSSVDSLIWRRQRAAVDGGRSDAFDDSERRRRIIRVAVGDDEIAGRRASRIRKVMPLRASLIAAVSPTACELKAATIWPNVSAPARLTFVTTLLRLVTATSPSVPSPCPPFRLDTSVSRSPLTSREPVITPLEAVVRAQISRGRAAADVCHGKRADTGREVGQALSVAVAADGSRQLRRRRRVDRSR